MTAIDGRFHGRFVSLLRTEPRGPSVPDNAATIFYGNHQPVPLAVGVFFKPIRESLHSKRLCIKRDGRIHDVMVINLREPWQIGEQPRPGDHVIHFEGFLLAPIFNNAPRKTAIPNR